MFIGFAQLLMAQGTVAGTVINKSTLEPVVYAKVKVEGQNKGALTDFDGNYKLQLPAGEYTLIFSEGEYFELKLQATVVDGQELTLDAAMESKVQDIKQVVVVAEKAKAPVSVAADDIRREKEAVASDGMTKDQMQKTGDSKAGDALARVPGVTVEGGKFVFVRGLGDRYTKTLLNGMQIPGLDPDRNSVQLDIFPTAVIDNITVFKGFTPDMAGDVAGGVINVITKDFPTEQEMKFNFGTSYNSAASFNQEFLSYKGGKTDYFGFDDGSRNLNFSPRTKIPDPVVKDVKTEQITRSFSDVMGTRQSLGMMNHKYGFSAGDVFKNILDKDGVNYGYNFSLNYSNTNSLKENAAYGDFVKSTDKSVYEMDGFSLRNGTIAENEVLWTALLGNSMRFNKDHKVSFNIFHTQNGVSTASSFRNNNIEESAVLVQENLQYTERRVSNFQLTGMSSFGEQLKLDWNVSPTISKIEDPDMRTTKFEEITTVDANGDEQISYLFDQSVGSEIRRTFRNLEEKNLDAKVDFTYSYKKKSDSLKSEIKFGGSSLMKGRDYAIYNYLFNFHNAGFNTFDPDLYFQSENIWTAESNKGLYATGLFEKANVFSGTQMVSAGYVMQEMPITSKFKAIYGVRTELAQNRYTGYDAVNEEDILNELVLNDIDVLPSANFVYTKKQRASDTTSRQTTNFRFGYATTVARPSFKEKSTVQILDPISGRRYNGNIDLLATDIHNFDVRWEHFFGNTELISASAFYKRFINPIETAAYKANPNDVTSINAGTADVYGLELEARKSLNFIVKKNENLNLVGGANFNYIVSRVNMEKVALDNGQGLESEREIRQDYARVGETIGKYRSMFGQAPYSINSFLSLSDTSKNINANISYNVQGERLAVVGGGRIADVFEMPFHSLNLKVSKAFGKQNQWNASLSASNLLMNKRRLMYKSFGAENQNYFSFDPGMTISLGVSYRLK